MSNAKPVPRLSSVQLGLSLLASIFLFMIGGILILSEIVRLIQAGGASPTAVQNLNLAAGSLLGGVLVLPSAWYAYHRLRSPESISSAPCKINNPWFLTLAILVLVPLALFAGNWIVRRSSLDWLLLPGISLLVTGLPILWLVLMGKRGLSGGSKQRQWGLFSTGLVFSPVVMIILEMAVLVTIIIGISVFVAFDPDLSHDFSNLATQLENTLPGSELWYEVLVPYIQKPAFLAGILAYTAVLVPLIEEAFKPLGLWLIAGRPLSPQEGFVGGVISGAGFAFFENLTALSTGGGDWALLAGTRISTALLHMLTTGLMGWALANAWNNRRYLRLALTYTFVAGLHGLWNALGISSFVLTLNTIPSVGVGENNIIPGLITIGLGLLAVINLALFLSLNRRLRLKPDSVLLIDEQ